MMYLKVPIGNDAFVRNQIQHKSIQLQMLVQKIADLPDHHVAFTLLRMCATDCRVTHLTRTVHPDQLNSLLEEFDGSV